MSKQDDSKMDDFQPRYMKVSTFCRVFVISKQTAYRLIKRGDIPVIKIGSSNIRIPMDYVEAVKDQNTFTPE